MCRLLGFVSESETNFSQLLGNSFENFIQLSKVHSDGWGLANHDHRNTSLVRETQPALSSNKFTEITNSLESNGALLHFRWATPGLAVNEENTHPFSFKGVSFIHNGSFTPITALDSMIDVAYKINIKGDGDSERFFYFLLTEIDKYGIVEGIRSGILKMQKKINYSSLNCMILSDELFIVVAEFNPDRIPPQFSEDYYELRFKQSGRDVVVASSGWDQTNWTSLTNHSMLIIDRKNLSTRVIALT